MDIKYNVIWINLGVAPAKSVVLLLIIWFVKLRKSVYHLIFFLNTQFIIYLFFNIYLMNICIVNYKLLITLKQINILWKTYLHVKNMFFLIPQIEIHWILDKSKYTHWMILCRSKEEISVVWHWYCKRWSSLSLRVKLLIVI